MPLLVNNSNIPLQAIECWNRSWSSSVLRVHLTNDSNMPSRAIDWFDFGIGLELPNVCMLAQFGEQVQHSIANNRMLE